MSDPIDPCDIEVGDIVRPIIRPITVTQATAGTFCGCVGSSNWYAREAASIQGYELVSRPAPKPQVGQS